jgi:hypothetical protein
MAAIINMQINGVPVTSIGLAGITVAILAYATFGAETPLGTDGDASEQRAEEGTAAGIVSGLTDMFEGKGSEEPAPAAEAEQPPETRGGNNNNSSSEKKHGGRRRRTPRGKKRTQRTHKRRIR